MGLGSLNPGCNCECGEVCDCSFTVSSDFCFLTWSCADCECVRLLEQLGTMQPVVVSTAPSGTYGSRAGYKYTLQVCSKQCSQCSDDDWQTIDVIDIPTQLPECIPLTCDVNVSCDLATNEIIISWMYSSPCGVVDFAQLHNYVIPVGQSAASGEIRIPRENVGSIPETLLLVVRNSCGQSCSKTIDLRCYSTVGFNISGVRKRFLRISINLPSVVSKSVSNNTPVNLGFPDPTTIAQTYAEQNWTVSGLDALNGTYLVPIEQCGRQFGWLDVEVDADFKSEYFGTAHYSKYSAICFDNNGYAWTTFTRQTSSRLRMRFSVPSPGGGPSFLRIVYNAPLDNCEFFHEWTKQCESFVGGDSFSGFIDRSLFPTCEAQPQDFVVIGQTLPPSTFADPGATILPNINEQCGIWQRSARVTSAYQFYFAGNTWFLPNRLSHLNSPDWAHVGTVEFEYV